MRRLLILLTVLIIFSACQTANDNKDDEVIKDSEENLEQEQEQEQEATERDDESNDTNNSEEESTDDQSEREPAYVLNEQTWYIEPIERSTNEKVVLLTIDDAPDNYALSMAETLKELDAPAIFFVNGHFIETKEEKETLRLISDMGFAIGNHTYSHRNLQDLSEEEQKEEIISVNDQIEEIIGERPVFFRAPFGQNTDYSREIIESEQMLSMNWSYGYDWNEDYMTKESITDIMIHADELRDGANLLMHDREWTAEALHDIVVGLRDQGYEFVEPHSIKIN